MRPAATYATVSMSTNECSALGAAGSYLAAADDDHFLVFDLPCEDQRPARPRLWKLTHPALMR